MTEQTYAIGDVHGRADLLESMLKSIASLAADCGAEYRVVFLGDIIDRGPQSREAVELVAETLANLPGSRLILGNHDWFPLRILDEHFDDQQDMALEHWVWNLGGDKTLESYGFDPAFFGVTDLVRHFPKDHLDLFRNSSAYVEIEDAIPVHAGLMPGVPLASQTRRDLMWIREPFLSSRHSFGKTVIHGHTVTETKRCEVFETRAAIDTGAYSTGRLSAAVIEPYKPLRFLATSAEKPGLVEYVDPVFPGSPY